MRPDIQWDEPVEIEAGRSSYWLFKLYKPNGKPAAIDTAVVARFKLSRDADDLLLLDIDSVLALDGGSVCTVVAYGTDDVTPAEVKVSFAQEDTADLTPGDAYEGELCIVDPSEANPPNAIKRAGHGPVVIKPSAGGDVGLT